MRVVTEMENQVFISRLLILGASSIDQEGQVRSERERGGGWEEEGEGGEGG